MVVRPFVDIRVLCADLAKSEFLGGTLSLQALDEEVFEVSSKKREDSLEALGCIQPDRSTTPPGIVGLCELSLSNDGWLIHDTVVKIYKS